MDALCKCMFIIIETIVNIEHEDLTCYKGHRCFSKNCTILRRVTAQTREPELIAAARVNACVGFIPARFWTVQEAALQGVYTAICHATSKTVKAPFIIWISWKKIKKYCIHSVHMRTEPKDPYRNEWWQETQH